MSQSSTMTLVTSKSNAGYGQGVGARAWRNNTTNGRLQLQQPIIINLGVHGQLASWRQQNIDDPKIPRERLFTPMLHDGRGDEFGLFHIQAADLLFGYTEQMKCKPLDARTESKKKVFSVFNGAEIPAGVTEQSEYEDGLAMIALSSKPFFFGKSFQPDMGVAGYIAGSKGVWNRGKDEVQPGDKLMWAAPNIDPVKREQERSELPYDHEHPKMRDSAIIKRLTYQDAHEFVQKELTASVADGVGAKYLFTNTLPGSNTYVSANTRAAIALRNMVCWSALAAISVLLKYRILSINVPGGGINPLSPANFNANKPIYEQYGLKDVLQTKIDVDRNTGRAQYSRELQTPEEFTRDAGAIAYIAGLLALIPSAMGSLTPSYNLINGIVITALHPFIMDVNAQNGTAIERFFPRELREGNTLPKANRFDLTTTYNMGSIVGSLCYVQDSIPRDMFGALGYATERVNNKVFSISMSNSRAGEWIDEMH